MTTNHKEGLYPALTRSGRIDNTNIVYICKTKHFFPNQNKKEFISIIKNLKYTTSDLHRFLFKNRKIENIIDEFIDYILKDNESLSHLYI